MKILKIFLFIIISIYLIIYFFINILGLKIGISYDNALVDSTAVFNYIKTKNLVQNSKEYWTAVNSAYKLETVKRVALGAIIICKALGFDVVAICARGADGSEYLKEKWKWYIDDFYFEKDIEEIFSSDRFAAYICSSNEEYLKAKKVGVYPIKISGLEWYSGIIEKKK